MSCKVTDGFDPGYRPIYLKIIGVTKETDDTKTYRLDIKGKGMEYDPGQFVQISVLGVGEAPISICSYSNNYMDLCIRDVGNVSKAIHKLKKGDEMGIRGPFGHGYPMHFMHDDNILVVAGGTGVAPVRGVIEYLEKERKHFKDVDIFFGFRSPDDVLFKRDMLRWAKNFNLRVTVDKPDKSWNKDVGLVTTLLEQSGVTNGNRVAVTCGPPIMIKFVIKTLEKLNFNHDQIYVSLERMMQCGVQKCGHCLIGGKYVCRDGPVFNYEIAKWLKD